MHERGKSDSPVVPAKPPNNAGRPAAEAVEERGWPRGTRRTQHVPDAVPEPTCQAGSIVCVKLHDKIEMHGSPHSCTMSISPDSGQPSGRSAPRPPRGSTGSPGTPTEQIWRRTSWICTNGFSRGATGQVRHEGVHREGGRAATAARHRHVGRQGRPTGRRRGAQRHLRGGLPRLSLTGFDQGAARIMRSMRSRSGLNGGG